MLTSLVITGVSTGIGAATARYAASRGAHIFGSVRRPEAAASLQAELGSRFTPLVFDVRDAEAVGRAASQVRSHLAGARLGGLVNNAGVAFAAPLAFEPIDEFREQMEINVVGPLIAAQAFLPLLGMDESLQGAPGRIVNISSVAGKLSSPFLGAYAASKHALEGWSGSLRRELLPFGIDVVVVAPGAVATPIWDKAEQLPTEAYRATVYGPILDRFRDYFLKTGRAGLPAEQIAAVVWQALTDPRTAPRHAVVGGKFANWTLPRLLPPRTLDRLIGGRLGLTRRR